MFMIHHSHCTARNLLATQVALLSVFACTHLYESATSDSIETLANHPISGVQVLLYNYLMIMVHVSYHSLMSMYMSVTIH